MKKFLAIVMAAAALCASVPAQTNTINTGPVQVTQEGTNTAIFTGPAVEALRFLATGSNWMIAPYGLYDAGSKKYGGGLAALYQISPFVATGMRLDWLDNKLWMPSGQFQLQAPLTIFNKLTVIPFAFSGIATPLSGRGNDNGSVVGIFGAGAAIRLTSHLDLVADVESWQGAGFTGLQYRGGILWKF